MAEMPEEVEEFDGIEEVYDESNMPIIFISYDTGDLELVNQLRSLFSRVFNNQVKTFVARHNIRPGDDAFQTMLHDNLANSRVVLAICTKNSFTSPWLWFESGAGFGCGKIIPLWVGVEPKFFGPPMTIFQGKRLEDREEFNELITELANCVGFVGEDLSITESEFSTLLLISTKLKNASVKERIKRIEDEFSFPLATPLDVIPVEYIIEAHFPFIEPSPLQSFLSAVENSRYFLRDFTGGKYPFIAPAPEWFGDIAILATSNQQSYSNQVRQGLFIKSGHYTLTQWVRYYHKQDDGTKFILSSEFIDEASRLYIFFLNLVTHFRLPNFDMRIRLYNLEGGTLHSNGITQKLFQSFKAPNSNEIEVKCKITRSSAEQDFMSLLMQVWEQFKTPAGDFARFNEREFLKFLDRIPEEDEEEDLLY